MESVGTNFELLEKQFENEVKVLSKCKHINIVPLISVCFEKPNYCLIYPLFEKGLNNNILIFVIFVNRKCGQLYQFEQSSEKNRV